MKALTIWQPWASLIMIGAKPFEFRRWDYRERERGLDGQRIVIHAGARSIPRSDIEDLIERINDNESSLLEEIAKPLIERVHRALLDAEAKLPEYRKALALHRRYLKAPRFVGDVEVPCPDKPNGQILPLAFALGTAVLGKPRRVTDLFRGRPDSDRLDQHMWAWPLTDIQHFTPPVEVRGLQGFWTYPFKEAA